MRRGVAVVARRAKRTRRCLSQHGYGKRQRHGHECGADQGHGIEMR